MDRVHNIKQVIILRKDLNMRKGKMAAQAAHASMGALFKREDMCIGKIGDDQYNCNITLNEMQVNWFKNFSKKIVVGVDSEKELLEAYDKAKQLGISCVLIQDAGFTEFGGVPTYTAVGIGPDRDNKIDLISAELKLL